MTVAKNAAQDSDYLESEVDSLVRWRREKVWELRSMGYTIDQIVGIIKGSNSEVKISHGTVHRDFEAKEQEIRNAFTHYIEEELPTQHRLAITSLDRILRETWRIYAGAHDDRIKLQALALAQSATMNKQELLGDPDAIKRAIQTAVQLRERMEKGT